MTAPVDAWGIVELFGHRKVAGRIREEQHFGESMCCIDVPDDRGDAFRTQMYGGKAIFGVHLTTEAEARAAAKHCSPAPFSWLLDRPQLGAPSSSSEHTSAGHRRAFDDDDQGDDDRDDQDDDPEFDDDDPTAEPECMACGKPLGDEFVTVELHGERQHRDCAEDGAYPVERKPDPAAPEPVDGGA